MRYTIEYLSIPYNAIRSAEEILQPGLGNRQTMVDPAPTFAQSYLDIFKVEARG
jgi:hypothetical protein